MSFNFKLKSLIKERNSCLCVGLDISPESLCSSNISSLKKHSFDVIDITRDLAIAYKPNFAFFERWGAAGFAWLEEIISYIGNKHILIADAKRGDIGNTAKQYAISIFDHFKFDAVTLSAYMGKDSIEPFINRNEKGVFILCRTSNLSAAQIQGNIEDIRPVFKKVAELANDLNINNNVGLVVGATAVEELRIIRKLSPDLPLLIPGVGAQGGDLEKSVKLGNQSSCALVNISRGISFAGDMSEKTIRSSAENYVLKMQSILNGK